jgi:hypothetical protein
VFVFTLILTLAVSHGAMAADDIQACTAPLKETPLRSEQASAGIMVNLAAAPGSIRATVKSLLDDAVGGAQAAPSQTVVFRVAPTNYLPLPEQQPLCTQLASETSLQPLKYADRAFATVEDFDGWLTAFSQGQGADGKLLYQQCGGNCDPSFTFVVSRGASSMTVATEVYCGYARDREINLYTLSTALREACSASP